jgi:hypothetical protein
MNELQAFLNSDAGLALKGLLIVSFLDFATGSFAALRDGTFALDAIAAFVRKHVLGRVAPIGLLLVVGYFGGEAGQLFLVGAIASAAAYVAETGASVLGNLNPPKASAVEETTDPATLLNPVPTE